MMKKNVMLRAAGVLMITVMLTTSVVSGTYAKYVTEDSSNDSARVAKFGVVATVSGDLFGDSYSAATDNAIQAWSLNKETVSADTKGTNVVAPGTKNDNGMTISVTGTPEVSTKLTLADADNFTNTDIVLNNGEYGVMVEYNGTVTSDTVTNYYTFDDTNKKYAKAAATTAADGSVKLYQLKDSATVSTAYKPIKWKIGSNEYSTVEEVKTALEFTTSTAKPNENLATEYGSKTVTWEWAFSDSTNGDITSQDKQDTILGDMIASDNSSKYTVVKKNGNDYDTVNYKSIKASTNSANEAVVAYTGDTAPAKITDNSVCACLTVGFGAKLTVTQVD